MDKLETLSPSQDERIMAALSHATALIPFMGVIAPIIIWATQKDKSEYIRTQSLQALLYQGVNVVIIILGYVCYFAGLLASIIIVSAAGAAGGTDAEILPMMMMALPLGVMVLLGLFELFFILYAIVAAVMSLQGKPFQYIIIGSRLRRYMERKDPPSGSQPA